MSRNTGTEATRNKKPRVPNPNSRHLLGSPSPRNGLSQEQVDELSTKLEALLDGENVDYEHVVTDLLFALPDSEYGETNGPPRFLDGDSDE